MSEECPEWGIPKEKDFRELTSGAIIAATAFMSPFLIVELNTVCTYRMSWLKQYWNVIDMGNTLHKL